MKQIRNSVFETNSSSTHSLSLGSRKDAEYVIPKHDKDTEVTYTCGEFGWEESYLETWDEKLEYILTAIQYHIPLPENYWEDKTANLVYNCVINSNFYKWLQEMIYDHCGLKIRLEKLDDNYYPMGYIDHQSTDMLSWEFVDDEHRFKDNMKNIIFLKDSYIKTDNDNH